jgi:Na+/melibiose symporter-like transporter
MVGLVLVWGPFPAVIAVVSMLIFASYNITRERHSKIALALRPKRQAQSGD